MSLNKIFKKLISQSFLWKLSTLNIIIITLTILLSSLAIYNSACILIDSMGNLNAVQQKHFNSQLFNYLLLFVSINVFIGGFLHYYLTKKLVKPIQVLIESTKQMKTGEYPTPIPTTTDSEIGELTDHFNSLIAQLKANDHERGQLISNLSHELRTPLTNLNGYLKALHDGVIKGDKELYDALLKESRRITDMVEQIEMLKEWGELSAHTYKKYELIDISELIEQSANMFQFQLDRRNILLSTKAETCALYINSDGILQVMTNLIDNALNYYDGTSPIKIRGKRKENSYYITVSNPGPSIPHEEHNHIFERLYRLDNSRNRKTGGSGLGLAIVKEIINKHGGEIRVTSENEITTFCIILPIK